MVLKFFKKYVRCLAYVCYSINKDGIKVKKEKTTQPQITDNIEADTVNEPQSSESKDTKKPAKVTKVGAMLKEMRLQKGLKLTDIAKKLCIRKMYLDAIEDSNYKDIPPLPYGIGFIRAYANYLGLNGENIVELYKEETSLSEPKDIHVLEPQPEASMPSMQYIVISILAIILIYLGWSSFNSNTPSQTVADNEEAQSVADTPSEINDESGVIVVEDFNFEPPAEMEELATDAANVDKDDVNDGNQIKVLEQSYEDNNKTDIKSDATQMNNNDIDKPKNELVKEESESVNIPEKGVFLEILKETWIEVKDASKLYISKVLQKGDTYTVPEGKGMILSLGNYDGANVYINGKLTKVARPNKKTNIALDPFLENKQ